MNNKESRILKEAIRSRNLNLFENLFLFLKFQRFVREILILSITMISSNVLSQVSDSTKIPSNFAGAVTVTNNGVSLIPTFTLGKPAVTFDLDMGRRKLSFEPEFQFSLEGKPWGFFFWWRYKLVSNSKFFIRIGAHPALSFSTLQVTTNGVTQETITAQRYLAGEFCPNYFLSKNISVGMYYLYSYGLDNKYVRNTNFLMLNMNFTNIKLSNKFSVSYMPQVYYLRVNDKVGYNITSTITLTKKDFPVSLSAFANKTIQSDIPGIKNFAWNVSLIYAFNKYFVEK